MDICGKAVAQEQDLLQVQVFCWILYWQECRCNTSRSMTSSPPCPTTSQVNRLRKQWIAGLVRSCQSRHMHLEMGGKNLQPYLEMALLSSHFWRLCSPCLTFPFSFPCFCPWFFEHLSPYQTCSPGRWFQGMHRALSAFVNKNHLQFQFLSDINATLKSSQNVALNTHPSRKKNGMSPKKEPFQKGKASSNHHLSWPEHDPAPALFSELRRRWRHRGHRSAAADTGRHPHRRQGWSNAGEVHAPWLKKMFGYQRIVAFWEKNTCECFFHYLPLFKVGQNTWRIKW